jgi:hypothetical protein
MISLLKKARDNAYRTAMAPLNANGAWYVVDEESNNTDCAASATGPNLADKQTNKSESMRTEYIAIYWLAATSSMYPVSEHWGGKQKYSRPTNSQLHQSLAV